MSDDEVPSPRSHTLRPRLRRRICSLWTGCQDFHAELRGIWAGGRPSKPGSHGALVNSQSTSGFALRQSGLLDELAQVVSRRVASV